jgi:hypothetical protein
MLRKLTLALVTAATLGAAALAPTAASAGGPWHPHYHHNWNPGYGYGNGYGFGTGFGYGTSFVASGYDCYRTRVVRTPYGYRYRTINVCAF